MSDLVIQNDKASGETLPGKLEVVIESGPNDIKIIRLNGILDMFSCVELKAIFRDLIDAKVSRVLIDMERLISIDSSGIGALLNFTSQAKKNSETIIVLCSLQRIVYHVFTMTRLISLFKVTGDRESALQFFETPAA
jgi:anti-anti-sigma factor